MRACAGFLALLWCIVILPQGSVATCYLEDASANCEVCWKTEYSRVGDTVGVTTMSECPPSIVVTWLEDPPLEMFADSAYQFKYDIAINSTAISVVPASTKKDGAKDIPHANVHSCVASRGACTPFVSNTPGLATHTAALVADLEEEGSTKFDSEVKLSAEQYVIIAHIRFYTPNTRNQELPPTKYDVAIGLQREVVDRPSNISADAYITAGILGAFILLLVGSLAYSARKGYVDLDKIVEILFSDTVTLMGDIISGIADVAAFTIGVLLVFRDNNEIVNILPLCYLFCGLAWIGSLYNAVNDCLQLRTMYLQTYHRAVFVGEMVDRNATKTVTSHPDVKGMDRRVRRRSIHETSVNFSELIEQQENFDIMFELELADRDYRRKIGDCITICCESIPITAIQSYALVQGTTNVISVIALLFASVVLGAKVSGLATYKACRVRRDKARAAFKSRFAITSPKPMPRPSSSEDTEATTLKDFEPTKLTGVLPASDDCVLEIGKDVPTAVQNQGWKPSSDGSSAASASPNGARVAWSEERPRATRSLLASPVAPEAPVTVPNSVPQ